MTREEAIRQLEYFLVCSENHVTMLINSRDRQAIDMAIDALKYSEIPNSLDIISRQAAIDAVRGRFSMPVDNLIVEVIGDLPSAQPERME